ncbi:hypothetical protein [Pontibacter sp. G13]|uniref:hypothetical protein n=1 Tax=Pontibacter sp. G13 TaxID=3074898 RepID=UPI00288BF8E3|nr:hypothetical protein [Pontibacter sp. G13]WNJ19705.1 hypothetical protein RJD25_04415 [Pontibacter sp. G13]
MVIYGQRAAHIGTAPSQNGVCPNCESEGTIAYSYFSRHAHVFWIPLFPFGKTGAAVCTNCQHTMEPKQMPKLMKAEFKELKADFKTPIWQFSGLAIIAGLFGWGYFSAQQTKANTQEYVAAPQMNDVYTIQSDDEEYTTIKVAGVDEDSVYIYINTMAVDKKSGIYKIDKEEYYLDVPLGVQHSYLDSLYQDGTILEIERE